MNDRYRFTLSILQAIDQAEEKKDKVALIEKFSKDRSFFETLKLIYFGKHDKVDDIPVYKKAKYGQGLPLWMALKRLEDYGQGNGMAVSLLEALSIEDAAVLERVLKKERFYKIGESTIKKALELAVVAQ